MRRTKIAAATFIGSAVFTAFGQQPAQAKFLAADIHTHVASSSRVSSGGTLRGERYELRNVTLLNLIVLAWDPDGEILSASNSG